MRRLIAAAAAAAIAATLSSITPAAAASVPPGQLAYLESGRRAVVVVREGHSPAWVASYFNPASFGEESFLTGPSWSPDGRAIAYGRTTYASMVVTAGEIRIVSLADRHDRVVVRLPAAGSVMSVTWSPDGRRLAFVLLTLTPASYVTWGAAGHRSDLYVVNVDGSGLRPVAPAHAVLVGPPVWSPDSTRLAFASDSQGAAAVYSVSASAPAAAQRITPLGIAARGPKWAPDGRRIAFLGTPIGPSVQERGLWVVDADGGRPRKLFGDLHDVPTWSPDSTQLAFGHDGGLFTVTVDGAPRLTRLTAGEDHNPVWSRRGEIAFAREWSDRGSSCGVFVVRPGGQPRRLHSPCGVEALDWSPA